MDRAGAVHNIRVVVTGARPNDTRKKTDQQSVKLSLALRRVFDFKGHKVRVVEIAGEPWFAGTDVLHILYG